MNNFILSFKLISRNLKVKVKLKFPKSIEKSILSHKIITENCEEILLKVKVSDAKEIYQFKHFLSMQLFYTLSLKDSLKSN